MDFTFNDVVDSTYRVDLFLVKRSDLIVMQTKLNQWSTTKLLVKYQISPIGEDLLFEVVRIKGGE